MTKRSGESLEAYAERLGISLTPKTSAPKPRAKTKSARQPKVRTRAARPNEQRTYGPRKEACKHGHALVETNIIVKRVRHRLDDGTVRVYSARQCKTCHAEQARARYHRDKMRVEDARASLKRIASEAEDRRAAEGGR